MMNKFYISINIRISKSNFETLKLFQKGLWLESLKRKDTRTFWKQLQKMIKEIRSESYKIIKRYNNAK